MSIDSKTAARNHDLDVIRLEEIKEQMRHGRQTFELHLARMEAEQEAERSAQIWVRARQAEQEARSGLTSHP